MTQLPKPASDLTTRESRGCCGTLESTLDPRFFKALADSTRVRLLANLVVAASPCSVGVAACCCAVDLSVVSRHLAALEDAAMLSSRRDGRQVLYTARTAALAARLRAIADALEAAATPVAARVGVPETAKTPTPHATADSPILIPRREVAAPARP